MGGQFSAGTGGFEASSVPCIGHPIFAAQAPIRALLPKASEVRDSVP